MSKKFHNCPSCGAEIVLVKHESRGAYKANRGKYQCLVCNAEETLYADGQYDENPDTSVAGYPDDPDDPDEQLCIHNIPIDECILCN